MRLLRMLLMLSFVGLSLSSCKRLTTDSYCQVYNPIVVTRGDGAISAPLAVKKRILTNEMTYRELCK